MGEDLSTYEERLERLRGVYFPWQPEDSQEACDMIRELIDALEEQAWEYGVQRPLSEEAWGPGHSTVAEYVTREEAVADMEYFDVKNGTLVRRRKAGPWEKI